MNSQFFLVIVVMVLFKTHSTAQNPGDILFDDNTIHTIELQFDHPDFLDSLYAHYAYNTSAEVSKKYLLSRITVDGTDYDSVGVRFKGYSSMTYPGDKKSLKIDINEYIRSQKIDGLKKINIHNSYGDPTMLREKLSYDIFQSLGVSAPRCSFAKVYINNTYWGFYSLVEQVDKTFLKSRFGNNDGNLYKAITSTLQWIDSNQNSYYNQFDLKTNESENDWSDLLQFINVVNNVPDNEFFDSLDKGFNYTDFLKIIATDNLLVNLDSYCFEGRNFYLYHNTSTHKFEWIPWDYNLSFSGFGGDQIAGVLDILYNNPSMPLPYRVSNTNILRNKYLSEICSLLEKEIDTTLLFSDMNKWVAMISADVNADNNKMFSYEDFLYNVSSSVSGDLEKIPGLKEVIIQRRTKAEQSLHTLNYSCTTSVKDNFNKSYPDVRLYPNPAVDRVIIEAKEIKEVIVMDLHGRIVFRSCVNSDSCELDLRKWPEGVYIVRITSGNSILSRKILKI
jgi:hypothetical protein